MASDDATPRRNGVKKGRKRDMPEYRIWHSMRSRCYNEKHTAYRHYGAKGVTVCRRWRQSFEAFLADVGPRPSARHYLDRFPNASGNYEPGNCRWFTREPHCTVKGCLLPVYAKGLCDKHYQRNLKHSDPQTMKRAPSGSGHVARLKRKPDYLFKQVFVFCPFRQRKRLKYEHTHLAEVHILGRALRRGEVVHHKDENPLNNALENLEVMTRSEHAKLHHPPGTPFLKKGERRADHAKSRAPKTTSGPT